MLPITQSTYDSHAARCANPSLLSQRVRRDEVFKAEIDRAHETNVSVYGVRKVWHQLQWEGHEVARCTVARLMRAMGLKGVIRGKKPKTTLSNEAAPCPLDRVNRQFRAPCPSRL